jgi:GNAT superfamily N-acetyltransferase
VNEVIIDVADPTTADAQRCLVSYFAELDERMATGFDPDAALPLPLDELRLPGGLFLLAHKDGDAVGCGGLHFMGDGVAEVKRMWLAPSVRGLGVGRRLLTALIEQAEAHGAKTLRLDTNASLTQAINLYRTSGFEEVAQFNDEPHATHWFERRLR